MITEDYCSFELSKLLKEKGFDCDCKGYDAVTGVTTIHNWKSVDGLTPCCTHQLAMKWLREVHGLNIFVIQDEKNQNCFRAIIQSKLLINGRYGLNRETYEEAVESAIKYCLTNLINNETN